jgi:hypothetical protein
MGLVFVPCPAAGYQRTGHRCGRCVQRVGPRGMEPNRRKVRKRRGAAEAVSVAQRTAAEVTPRVYRVWLRGGAAGCGEDKRTTFRSGTSGRVLHARHQSEDDHKSKVRTGVASREGPSVMPTGLPSGRGSLCRVCESDIGINRPVPIGQRDFYFRFIKE